jgi:type VI secretion system secreted protein VgrG
MPSEMQKSFSFTSKALDPGTFEVVRFHGDEGLSRLYRFTVTLVCARNDLDMTAVVQNPACLTIHFPEGDLPFHGILASFEQRQTFAGMTFYQADLVPKTWWLTMTHHNQIFLDQTLPEYLAAVLEDGGLKQGLDFEFRLSRDYPKREYVCQYRETHFNFVSRWMERDGIYYFFEQSDSGEKLVITDNTAAHTPMLQGGSLMYLPVSGLDWPVAKEAVKRFSLTQKPLPAKVTLKDYNYRQPDQDLTSEASVADHGQGEFQLYGDHFATASEGRRLAKIRAEEYLCREKLFSGLSTAPYVRSGYVFSLTRHFLNDFNADYLTITARHEGGQESYLVSGLGLPLKTELTQPFYRNTFEAIPAKTQFRAQRTAEKPRFYGVQNAIIDAAGSGQYAELDAQGRYKIRLPFDLSGRGDGKASAFVRMAQPYGGSDHGLHFPLHKGTEVLLTYIDGDPDRPIIQACVPNPDNPSPVTGKDSTACRLTTSGGNKLHIENRAGAERFLLQSPSQNSYIRLGQPNDPPGIFEDAPDQLGWKINTDGAFKMRAGLYNQMIIGDSMSWVGGNYTKFILGELNEWHGTHHKFGASWKDEISMSQLKAKISAQKALGETVALDAECMKIAGQCTRMRAAKTTLEATAQRMAGQRSDLVAAKQRMETEKLALLGTIERISGVKSEITQSVEELQGQQTALRQARTAIETNSLTLSGQRSQLEQMQTRLAANASTLVGQQSDLSQMQTTLAANASRIMANRTII